MSIGVNDAFRFVCEKHYFRRHWICHALQFAFKETFLTIMGAVGHQKSMQELSWLA